MDELSLPFDVVVVGAGVNGLGIARDAALRGLRVALLEQDDLCSGVSAWSGRLVHGGLRYLEHRDFALVRESLRERELLFRLAPHLVKPVRLLMPFYAHNRRPPWMIRLGMVLYDGLSFDKKTGRHEILDKAGITARFTGIGTDGLTGSAVFTDGQVEAAERLCVELAVAAAGDGAVIRTKARVDEPLLENGRVAGVRCRDLADRRAPRGARQGRLQRRRPVDRPGASAGRHRPATAQRRHQGQPPDRRPVPGRADRRRLLRVAGRRTARAGHPVDGPLHVRHHRHPVRRRPRRRALRRRRDGLHPRRGQHARARGEPHPGRRALHLLRRAAAALRAGQEGERRAAHPRAARARRRPARAWSRSSAASSRPTGSSPRTPSTTRSNGWAARRRSASRAGCRSPARSPTRRRCARTWSRRASRRARRTGCSSSTAAGPPTSSRSPSADPELLREFDPDSGAIGAELVFAVRHEFARTLADVLARRVLLAFEPGHGLASVERAAEILGAELGWDERPPQGGDRGVPAVALPPRDPGAGRRDGRVRDGARPRVDERPRGARRPGRAHRRRGAQPGRAAVPASGLGGARPGRAVGRAARQREAGAGRRSARPRPTSPRSGSPRTGRPRSRGTAAPARPCTTGSCGCRTRPTTSCGAGARKGSTPRSGPAPGSTTTRTSPRRSSPGYMENVRRVRRAGPPPASSPSAPSTRGCCGTSPAAARTSPTTPGLAHRAVQPGPTELGRRALRPLRHPDGDPPGPLGVRRADFGEVDPRLLGGDPGPGIPVTAILADQQAGLFGQACFTPGVGEEHLRHRRGAHRELPARSRCCSTVSPPASRGRSAARRCSRPRAWCSTAGRRCPVAARPPAACSGPDDEIEPLARVRAGQRRGVPRPGLRRAVRAALGPRGPGRIVGLTLEHGAAHVVRAGLEAWPTRPATTSTRSSRAVFPSPSCGSTAAPPPTTCSASSRPTSAASRRATRPARTHRARGRLPGRRRGRELGRVPTT